MRVSIVHDGCSRSEKNPEVSCQQDIIKELHSAFKSLGYESLAVPCTKDVAEFLLQLRKSEPDVVFNICESIWARNEDEMKMAAILDTTGLPYTGSGPVALGLSQDKALSKYILRERAVPTPDFDLIHSLAELEAIRQPSFPVIIKPSREDGSEGIEEAAVAYDMDGVRKRVELVLTEFKQSAIIETFIEGRELNVSLLGNGDYDMLPISEITFSNGKKVCGYKAKWVDDCEEYRDTVPACPAVLSGEEEKLVEQTAKTAAKLHQCSGYVRIDIRLSKEDSLPYVIDVNPNPDLSRNSGLVRSAKAAGISFTQLAERIVELALAKRVSSQSGIHLNAKKTNRHNEKRRWNYIPIHL